MIKNSRKPFCQTVSESIAFRHRYQMGFHFILVKKILFTLVSRAEKEFGSGTGELKKAAVIEWIYEKLPKIVTVFITPKEIERLIESVLEYAKTKWAANTALQDYIDPTNIEIQ